MRLILLLLLGYFLISCEKEDILPDLCIGGDCSVALKVNAPQDTNGYYHLKLNYDGQYDPRFNIEVIASKTDEYYHYNSKSVVTAGFSGDIFVQVPLQTGELTEFIPLVQETRLYLRDHGKIPNKMYTKRIIGPVLESLKGDTLNVSGYINWDGGNNWKEEEVSLKFIIE
jgi:hypothetical protein|tara:strand:+ start:1254 stop:1763 length:510 start_codon:yes stop_codon:yes gene_type:complete